MQGFLLQDWTTIRMQFSIQSVIQSEANWLDLQDYQDATAWLELRECTIATGHTSLRFDYETAPTRDESMFRASAASPTFTATPPLLATSPDVQKLVLGNTVPLARWLRWKLIATAVGSSGVSDVTFRIAVAGNRVGGR